METHVCNNQAPNYLDLSCSLNDNSTVTLYCEASCGESQYPIWGTDIYTSDSPICRSAIHDGKLATGESGYVAITNAAQCDDFVGSTRNGITTLNYGEWPQGSFKFVNTIGTII